MLRKMEDDTPMTMTVLRIKDSLSTCGLRSGNHLIAKTQKKF